MGVVFGLLSALCIGGTDLFGRRANNETGPLTLAVALQFIAVIASAATLLVWSGPMTGADYALAAGSGIGFTIGLTAYFAGLTQASSAVVAPVVATLSVVGPFSYITLRGTDPSTLAVVGAAVAAIGILMVTIGGERDGNIGRGFAWALVSGGGFAIGTSLLIDISEGSGAGPAIVQRSVALAVVAALAARRRHPLVPPRHLRGTTLASGIMAAGSTIFYLLGAQADATATAVTGATFPAMSVTVGWLVYNDRVTRLQVGGVAVVLAGVMFVTAG